MARVCIDDLETPVKIQDQDKLIAIIEQILETIPANRIVTGIRLDGKEISSINRQMLLDTPTHEVRDIDIRTSDKAIWAVNGVDTCLSSAERVRRSLLKSAEMFHGATGHPEKLSEAYRFFAHCMEGLERFTETLLITRNALNLDFKTIEIEGRSLASVEEEFSRILKLIFHEQKRKNYPTIADIIEDELALNLCTWGHALRKIQRSLSSNA